MKGWGIMKKMYRIKNGAPYVFMVLPALLIFVTFFIVPLIYTAKYSFYNWTNFSQEITFNGLENYKSIFEHLSCDFLCTGSVKYVGCGISVEISYVIQRLWIYQSDIDRNGI